ncbi:MAG TPA: hypothetical protein VFU93_05645 [Acidimicrobiales bacterium]|nr:hypothetical protein [Acidimicrobiales bacterium]
MRRSIALAVTVLLVTGACSSGDDDETAATTTTTEAPGTTTTEDRPSTTEPAVESLSLTAECTGIGTLDGDAEISWLSGGRIWTAPASGGEERCVARYAGPSMLQWGGAADRLLAGTHSVLVESGVIDVVPDHVDALAWSRPSGRALLARDAEGATSKLSLVGEPPLDLQLPFTEGEVLYHPAGTAIALVSDTEASSAPPDLLLADNRGEDVRWLVTNESADDIDHLAFTADGALVFTARHGDDLHVHRLVLGSSTVENLLATTGVLGSLVTSPYDDELVALGRTGCTDTASQELWLHDASTTGDVAATDAAMGDPVGWLPDGGLVVLVHDDGCDDQPGDLFVVRDGTATLVAADVEAAAVRSQLPPPPPPPPEIEAAPA